jgi:hypothetical protein
MQTNRPPTLRLVPTTGGQKKESAPRRLTSPTRGTYQLDELSPELFLSVLEATAENIKERPDRYAVDSPYGVARYVWDYLRVQHDEKATALDKLVARHVIRKVLNEMGSTVTFE